MADLVQLGKSDVHVFPIALGTNAVVAIPKFGRTG